MMKTIIYNSSFIPPEWIVIHDCIPRKISVKPNQHPETAGQCSYAHAFMENAIIEKPAAIIYVTSCDQMRHIGETADCDCPVFTFNMPSTWMSKSGERMYIYELKRLSQFLIKLGGSYRRELLAQTLLDYDNARRRLRNLKSKLSPKEFFKLLMSVNDKGVKALDETDDQADHIAGFRLALTGAPLTLRHLDLFELLSTNGGNIVLNCCENGEWSLVRDLNRRNVQSEPFFEMVDAYFSIPEIFRRPNNLFFRRLRQELADNDIQGIIINRYPWCDKWNAEVQRIRNFTSVPVLDLDMDINNETRSDARLITRIQAFMEALTR